MSEPVITLKHFFERAREGQLTAIRCDKCGTLAVPPKEFCSTCQQRAWTPVPLTGEGTIASFTVIRVAPRAHTREVPYAIAAVQLKEGVSLLGRVVDIPIDNLAVGFAVRFCPLLDDGKTAIGFRPA